MSDSDAIIKELKKCNSVLISAHVNPDGDALGSQLGLALALRKWNKQVTMHNLDAVPEIYRFLPHADEISVGKEIQDTYDAVIVVDADPPRTGLFDKGCPAKTLINIDHHVTNERMWKLTWLDTDAAATGLMIYKFVQALGVPIDAEIALCLYTSILTDTGSFRYTNTSPESMRVCATLIEAGADPWLVTENVYESFRYERLKLLGIVLDNMERTKDGRIGWAVVSQDLYRQTKTSAPDTDNFVNFVRSVKGVEVAAFFRQTAASQYKISLRSKGRVDLSAFAQTLGGGGHKNAAGCTLEGSIEQVKTIVLEELQKIISTQIPENR